MYALDTAAVATPIGLVMIEGDQDVVRRIRFHVEGEERQAAAPAVREAAAQVEAYFAGKLRVFDLPLMPTVTARSEVLRQAMVDVGYGDTASYGELAKRIGSSARALGQACARNPFPLVVPCHRVLQAGGVLGPYSAGEGPSTKRWLLNFEASGEPQRLSSPAERGRWHAPRRVTEGAEAGRMSCPESRRGKAAP